MRIKKEKRKYSLFLLPLMCLTLFAGAMATGVTYSSYTSVASSDGDSATVAKFDVDILIGKDANGNSTIISVENGERVEVPISITNNSEVTVEYDVVLTLPKALPSNEKTGKSVVCAVNGEVVSGLTHTLSGTIIAGGSANATVVIASEEAGASGISDLNSLTFEGVKIDVYATQVD